MLSNPITNVEGEMAKLKQGLSEELQNFSEVVTQRIDRLDTSFSIDMSVYDSLCQHIIEDLYQAKLSILYDEYNATQLAKELFSFQQYQQLLIQSPWYKKLFKFQRNELKKKAEVETAKNFEEKIKNIEKQIQDFTYEGYKKKFKNEVEEKYQAVNEAINCQHASYETNETRSEVST